MERREDFLLLRCGANLEIEALYTCLIFSIVINELSMSQNYFPKNKNKTKFSTENKTHA